MFLTLGYLLLMVFTALVRPAVHSSTVFHCQFTPVKTTRSGRVLLFVHAETIFSDQTGSLGSPQTSTKAWVARQRLPAGVVIARLEAGAEPIPGHGVAMTWVQTNAGPLDPVARACGTKVSKKSVTIAKEWAAWRRILSFETNGVKSDNPRLALQRGPALPRQRIRHQPRFNRT
jgi:hypothetical protein